MDISDSTKDSEYPSTESVNDSREHIEALLKESGINPDEFYANFTFMERVLQSLMDDSEVGFHIVKVSMAKDISLFIAKSHDNLPHISNHVSSFATHTAMSLTRRGGFGLEMRSYFNGGSDDSANIHEGIPQALRSWMVKPNALEPLTAQQCIDIHCTDLVTGKFIEPELNVAYRSGWLLKDDTDENFIPLA